MNPGALLSLLSAFPQDGDVYVGKPSLDHPIKAHELLESNKTVRSHHALHRAESYIPMTNTMLCSSGMLKIRLRTLGPTTLSLNLPLLSSL